MIVTPEQILLHHKNKINLNLEQFCWPWKFIEWIQKFPSYIEISSCRLQHFCCGRFSFSALICKGSGLDLPCLQRGHRSSANSWEKCENEKIEIQTYLSSNQPNLDLTKKGLKEVFWWMSSTQVLSKCSRLGELTTACWREFDCVWISFWDLGWVEIWRYNPVCAHAGPPVIVVDVVCLPVTFITFVHCPSIPPLFFINSLLVQDFLNVEYLCRRNRWWLVVVGGATEDHLNWDPPEWTLDWWL